ncbi:hypothetical protein ACWZJV_04655 [Nocardioides sp. WG-D5]|uniref:hypothetical protein n=1 Tax=Nocardioides luteus TaxID=1844 RepID=UPI000202920C|nr:hypothetical protein [Nocardioides luteus]EGD43780.1 hypothetical protein NBCG_01907 [Nocardioidaceae bacterium Broad-1]MBG6095619.1 hypothetical protein [Nocardioides luteus]
MYEIAGASSPGGWPDWVRQQPVQPRLSVVDPVTVTSVPDGSSNTWKLMEKTEVVGLLTVTGSDFPWLEGAFVPSAGFDKWRAVFAEESRLVEHENLEETDEYDAWELLVEQITGALNMVDPQGQVVEEFLLHIDGAHASWRW